MTNFIFGFIVCLSLLCIYIPEKLAPVDNSKIYKLKDQKVSICNESDLPGFLEKNKEIHIISITECKTSVIILYQY